MDPELGVHVLVGEQGQQLGSLEHEFNHINRGTHESVDQGMEMRRHYTQCRLT